MDDMLTELLSRYLDDDLTAAERSDFEARLAADPELRAEVEAARKVQHAIARLAGEMHPPAALDAVMEPMLRSAPAAQRRVRPAFRWLGAAAAVVLGVTVAMEVARRNPQPELDRTTAPRVVNHDDTEIFQLAPLPSAVPSENRPLGATDHLLEEDLESPAAPEPEPLEIMGPLPTGDLPSDDDAAAAAPAREEKGGLRAAAGADAAAASAPSAARLAADETPAGRAKGEPKRAALAHPVAVTVDGAVIWSGRSSCLCETPIEIRIRVRDGVIAEATEVSGGRSGATRSCLPADLVGARIEGVADGEHRAEIAAAAQ